MIVVTFSKSRCDETQLPTVPRGKSVSQRKIFWRSSSGNVIFSSLAEMLHNEDGLLEFTEERYKTLADAYGWKFLGDCCFCAADEEEGASTEDCVFKGEHARDGCQSWEQN